MDKVGNFADLDLSVVDFNKREWSWGFGHDDKQGVIRHCTDEGEVTEYHIPQCIADIIIESREYKVEQLKAHLRHLDAQRAKLLE